MVLKLLGLYHLATAIASVILFINSIVGYSRTPPKIVLIGRVNFCSNGALFAINVVCCLLGIGE